MGESQRSKIVLKTLNKIYPKIKVPLKSRNVFTLLISVLLSAQCTDERVNRVTPGLFRLANHPQAMAEVPEEDILTAIKSCGLAPTKARNIKKLSVTLAKEFLRLMGHFQ